MMFNVSAIDEYQTMSNYPTMGAQPTMSEYPYRVQRAEQKSYDALRLVDGIDLPQPHRHVLARRHHLVSRRATGRRGHERHVVVAPEEEGYGVARSRGREHPVRGGDENVVWNGVSVFCADKGGG